MIGCVKKKRKPNVMLLIHRLGEKENFWIFLLLETNFRQYYRYTPYLLYLIDYEISEFTSDNPRIAQWQYLPF